MSSASTAPARVIVSLELSREAAAGLRRFADKVGHSDAAAVLYPHVKAEIRDEQAYAIVEAFGLLQRALADAGVATWPWIETGHV